MVNGFCQGTIVVDGFSMFFFHVNHWRQWFSNGFSDFNHWYQWTRSHTTSNSFIALGNKEADKLAKEGLAVALNND